MGILVSVGDAWAPLRILLANIYISLHRIVQVSNVYFQNTCLNIDEALVITPTLHHLIHIYQ